MNLFNCQVLTRRFAQKGRVGESQTHAYTKNSFHLLWVQLNIVPLCYGALLFLTLLSLLLLSAILHHYCYFLSPPDVVRVSSAGYPFPAHHLIQHHLKSQQYLLFFLISLLLSLPSVKISSTNYLFFFFIYTISYKKVKDLPASLYIKNDNQRKAATTIPPSFPRGRVKK